MNLNGIKVVQHPLAITEKVEFKVVRWNPLRLKRRKNWCVKRCVRQIPGAFQVGDTLFVHPELFERLKTVPLSKGGE